MVELGVGREIALIITLPCKTNIQKWRKCNFLSKYIVVCNVGFFHKIEGKMNFA
jgi:hypothetical protein